MNKNIPSEPENCPHCGIKLSPWQKVLLGVDRILVCKNCWYRIILDISNQNKNQKSEMGSNSRKSEG